jgi:hypothetical protein
MKFGRLFCTAVLLTRRMGRPTDQAANGRLHTVASRIRSRVKSCEICNGKRSTEAGFLLVLQFAIQNLIPLSAPQSSLIWG